MKQLLKKHGKALGVISLFFMIGQYATLAQHPLIYFAGDSQSYLDAASALFQGDFFPSLRTPGYPLFIAPSFLFNGVSRYQIIVFFQAILLYISLFEIYVIVYRLTQQRWVSCAVASVLAINLYLLNWERSIISETLSFWTIVTLCLCFDIFLGTKKRRFAILFSCVAVFAILTRPFFVFVPFLLLSSLLCYSLWKGELARSWKPIVLSLALVYGSILGYMVMVDQTHHYFGLTWVTNINVFGKIIEYHMQDDSRDPQFDVLRSQLDQYVQSGQSEPWTFINTYAHQTYSNQASQIAAFNHDILIHHPKTFLLHMIPDIFSAWLTDPEFYAPYGNTLQGNYGRFAPYQDTPVGSTATGGGPLGITYPNREPWWINMLILFSNVQQKAYWLLPAIILCFVIWAYRSPQGSQRKLLFAYLLILIGSMLESAIGSYAEFYRLRFPLDWVMTFITILWLHQIAKILSSKYSIEYGLGQ